jgi:hypothetical protein
VSVFSARKIVVSALVWLALSDTLCAAPSGVGFQATLGYPLDVHEYSVTKYKEHQDEFSVANPPLSYPVFSRDLLFNPGVIGSSYDSSSIRMQAKYRRGELIPISVDAYSYYKYRAEKAELDRRRQLFQSSFAEAKRGNQRQGLSIGVDLPKRFDQMFGEGGANLQVSGYRRITFSGRSRFRSRKITRPTFRSLTGY